MDKIDIWLDASVIEYSLTRKILWRLGFGQRREGDYLLVFDHPESGFYVPKKSEQEPIIKLYVDEGSYDSCQREDTVLTANEWDWQVSKPWDELCDFTDLMSAIVTKFAPNEKIEGTGLMGRGARKRHFAGQYAQILTGLIENPEHELGQKLTILRAPEKEAPADE